MSKETDALLANVTGATTEDDSLIALLDSFHQIITDAPNDKAAIAQIDALVTSQRQKVVDAFNRNRTDLPPTPAT